jgi:hypothetical protein
MVDERDVVDEALPDETARAEKRRRPRLCDCCLIIQQYIRIRSGQHQHGVAAEAAAQTAAMVLLLALGPRPRAVGCPAHAQRLLAGL